MKKSFHTILKKVLSAISIVAILNSVLMLTPSTFASTDYLAPAVTINQSSTQVDSTQSRTVEFTMVFSEPVVPSTVKTSRISTVGSTAPGVIVNSITQVAPNDGTTYNVSISTTGTGTVVASVLAGTPVSSVLAPVGTTPSGIAKDSNGNLYIVNYDSSNVTKVTPEGVSSIFASTGDHPSAIVIDSNNNLFVTNYSNNNVTKILPDGSSSIFSTTGGNPLAIAIDSNNNLYVANSSTNDITKILPDGSSMLLGTTGTSPHSIVVDSVGNIYTANFLSDNVTKMLSDGSSSIFSTTGANPYSIAIDSNGNLYTANYSDNSVTKIFSDGSSAYYGATGFSPRSITVGSDGSVYTANYSSNDVTKILPGGEVITVLASTDLNPNFITTDSENNVYVTDGGYNVVTKITQPGILDLAGNYNDASTSTDNQVTIDSDHTVPEVTLSGATTVTVPYGHSYTDSGASWSDNTDGSGDTPVGIYSESGSFASSGSVNTNLLGTYHIDYLKVDVAGNASLVQTRTVNVTDQEAPTVTLSGATEITINLNSTYVDSGATWSDNVDSSGTLTQVDSLEHGLPSELDTHTVGTYTISYKKVDSSSNTSNTAIRTIHVVDPGDLVLPEVTLSGSTTVTVAQGSVYTDSGASWTDNIDGSGSVLVGVYSASGSFASTGSVNTSVVGTYTISYKKVDNNNNSSIVQTRTINVTDQTAPIVTLSGATTVSIVQGSIYTDSGASWTDTVDGSGSTLSGTYNTVNSFASTGSVNTAVVGTYTISYKKVDLAGNSSNIATRTITITAPVTTPSGGGSSGGGSFGGGSSSSSSSSSTSSSTTSTTVVTTSSGTETNSGSSVTKLVTQVNVSSVTSSGTVQYKVNNRVTDYICSDIVQTTDKVKSRDLGNTFADDIQAVIMYSTINSNLLGSGSTYDTVAGITNNNVRFNPNNNITRAEFVKMIVRSLGCHYTYVGTDSKFSDVDQNMWYAEYITYAVNNGWISGYSDGTFHPNSYITRGEMAKILTNAIKLASPTVQTSSFTDVTTNNSFISYIEALKSNKIVGGKTVDTFEPDSNVTRGEVSRVIYKTFLGGTSK